MRKYHKFFPGKVEERCHLRTVSYRLTVGLLQYVIVYKVLELIYKINK